GGEWMALGQLPSLDAQLDASRQSPRAGDVTDHASSRACLLDFLTMDVDNSVDSHSRMRSAECQLSENLHFLQRIGSAYIEGRICLGEPALLRQPQRGGEVGAVFFHPREDVIARSVHDSDDALDRVAGKAALDCPDDRDRK